MRTCTCNIEPTKFTFDFWKSYSLHFLALLSQISPSIFNNFVVAVPRIVCPKILSHFSYSSRAFVTFYDAVVTPLNQIMNGWSAYSEMINMRHEKWWRTHIWWNNRRQRAWTGDSKSKGERRLRKLIPSCSILQR